MMTFGELVRSARMLRGLRQLDLAVQSGLTASTIVSIERGATGSPSFYNAMRLCAVLGIEVDAAVAATLHEHLPPSKVKELPERVQARLKIMQYPEHRYRPRSARAEEPVPSALSSP